jgi:FdrA protein
VRIGTLVRAGAYQDSIALMQIAAALAKRAGVLDASAVMGTEANKGLLAESGLLELGAEAATPQDLIVAISAVDDPSLAAALAEADRLLSRSVTTASPVGAVRPRSLRSAVRAHPEANMAVISVAGPFAVAPAWDALRAGLHVLLFSDHVSFEDEISLKCYARDHGLLLMGPGAGTAILNGIGLGFANVVPRGPLGIVAAAGTGLQEVSTLLAKAGVGVSQAIGTGGRDVGDRVGGIMLLEGLRALDADPETEVIVVVSKVSARAVSERLGDAVARLRKRVVFALMGAPELSDLPHHGHQAATLWEAAAVAAAWVRREETSAALAQIAAERAILMARGRDLAARLAPGQRYLRGLYSGGTLCEETLRLWMTRLGEAWSNVPVDARFALDDARHSRGHTAVDLGDEEFTRGRPHPMIDFELRLQRLAEEGRDPSVAALVLDVVLGYGAHPDPASELAPAVRSSVAAATAEGRALAVIASVTGTAGDPQGIARQTAALEDAGVIVAPSNAAAALLAAELAAAAAERAGTP